MNNVAFPIRPDDAWEIAQMLLHLKRAVPPGEWMDDATIDGDDD